MPRGADGAIPPTDVGLAATASLGVAASVQGTVGGAVTGHAALGGEGGAVPAVGTSGEEENFNLSNLKKKF